MTHLQHSETNGRLKSELQTIEAMIHIFCHDHHHTDHGRLCNECSTLLLYAGKRLVLCPFQENKPTCGNCTVHCYKKGMRERVRKIMRYSGPKMIFRHPIMAIRHLLAGRRKPPVLQQKKTPGETST